MGNIEKQLKDIAIQSGAALVGIASRARLNDAPPSGDPGYLLPSAQSIISFAIPFKRNGIREFLTKSDCISWNQDKKENVCSLYTIGDHLVNHLDGLGFDSIVVDVNHNYRPEPDASDSTEVVDMVPEFSHRYGAVAAGLGRLGWSGNLITHQYGSALQLGTVLTSAKLESDPLIDVNPCDRCLMCVASCPVEMMHKEESVEVKIAGLTEKIAKKRSNNSCWLGCTGYHGLSPDRKWSTWSPYRTATPLTLDDTGVDELCTQIRKVDPDVNLDDLSLYSNYRESYFHPDLLFFSVCCNCANVCWENRKDRIKNLSLLRKSGVVVLRANGERSAVDDENEIIEIDTPFNMKVALLRDEYEGIMRGEIPVEVNKKHTLLDMEVLRNLKRSEK